MFKFLIPDKTHRKAESLETEVPAQVTVIAVQAAAPRVIGVALTGPPKDRTATLTIERTIAVTVTLREGIKAAAVV